VKTADQRTTMRLSGVWGLGGVFSVCLEMFWAQQNAREMPVKQHFKHQKQRKSEKKGKFVRKIKF